MKFIGDDQVCSQLAEKYKTITIPSHLKTDVSKAIPLQGEHNNQNVNAANLIANEFGISDSDFQTSVNSFPGLKHRQQVVGSLNGIQFINDSKATNIDAAKHALRRFENIHLIMGGVFKESSFSPLVDELTNVDKVYAIGQSQDEIFDALSPHKPVSKCNDLTTAMDCAYSDALQKQGTVLLSPACASFDQFKNFEARGDAFITFFNELAKRENH